MATLTVIDEVIVERVKQDDKWGGPSHDDLHSIEDFSDFMLARLKDRNPTRRQLIQVAALAVAAVEMLDRCS